jgi:succinylglutamate desuccinylase
MIDARPSRTIAHVRGAQPGPTLILCGAVHGNEPAGVVAASAVLADLAVDSVAGEILALVGNTRAVAAGKRFLEHDLNRLWTPERLARGREGERVPAELVELVELHDSIDRAIARAVGPVYVVDLHTTSAAGVPFAVVGGSPESRAFAAKFPLPGIVGLEETLVGTLTRYFGGRGCITLAVEGGQSATTLAAANLESVVTIALEAAGVVEKMPGADSAGAHLARVRGELPAMIEIESRHPVAHDGQFTMVPGFANIHATPTGTLLAHEHGAEIRAPFDGYVLLPLYQPQGEDGFFYGRALA